MTLAASCVTAVVKIASRCNLSCSYCYVYHKGDDGWRNQPALMTEEIISMTIDRFIEHCKTHLLSDFEIVFHGGEPLLAGPNFFKNFVETALARMPSQTRLTFTVQTNGVLLNSVWSRLLRQLGIQVGISIDGTRATHDRMRVDHLGRGSYARVLRGLEAARAEGLDPGILTVVDLADDPRAVFENLMAMKPRMVDFLLPLANWDDLPHRHTPTSYADWLITVFELWIASPTPPFRIRLFEQIVRTTLGFTRNYDALGPGVNRTIVIETDGSIESVDVLRVCGNGMTRRGYNVLSDSIDSALTDPLAQTYLHAADRLCSECRACEIKNLCAGGYLPHRFARANDFDNVSVYCTDLLALIKTIQDWSVRQVPSDLRDSLGLRSLKSVLAHPLV